MEKPPLSPLVLVLVCAACGFFAPLVLLFVGAGLMSLMEATSPVMSSGGSQSESERMAPAFLMLFVIGPLVSVLGAGTAWAALTHKRTGQQQGGAKAALWCGAAATVVLVLTVPLMVQGGWQGRAAPPLGAAVVVNTLIVLTVALFPAAWALLLGVWGWRRTKKPPPE